MTTRTYRGRITEHDSGDAPDILYLTEIDEPLAEAIRNDINELGAHLTVRYHITDTARPAEDLDESLAHLAGLGEAAFAHRYSEITGYLWTDEEITVGGHDLLEELRSHAGKFCHLEITYAQEQT